MQSKTGATEVQELDVEQVMARIRESVRQRRSGDHGAAAPTAAAAIDNGHGAADFAQLDAGYDLRKVGFTSHRPVLGWAIVLAKRIVRKLLLPILERQSVYNAVTARAVESLQRQLRQELGVVHDLVAGQSQAVLAAESRLREALAAQARDLARDLGAEQRARAALAAAQPLLQQSLDDHARQLHASRVADDAARLRIARAERKLRRILHLLQADPPGNGRPAATGDSPRPALPPPALEPEFDYAGFEEQFRGAEEDVKTRQRPYVRYFDGRQGVLDIGCGRGEFLELLRESGIGARGVDLDLDMVLLCREKGLDAVMADAFAYLAALPDDSVGGVFAAQVIEHLPSSRIIDLVKLCARKLAPGAALVLETPNPGCLMVFADSFYRDLFHVRPIHPDTMKFLLEATGFQAVELEFVSPVDASLRMPPLDAPGAGVERFNQGLERLNALLFGHQDYAVIGRKGRGGIEAAVTAPEPAS